MKTDKEIITELMQLLFPDESKNLWVTLQHEYDLLHTHPTNRIYNLYLNNNQFTGLSYDIISDTPFHSYISELEDEICWDGLIPQTSTQYWEPLITTPGFIIWAPTQYQYDALRKSNIKG